MNSRIYEQILKKGDDGFLKVKGYKNELGEYIDFDILDYNNSLIDILKLVSKNDSINLKQYISGKFKKNEEGIDENTFMENVEKNEFQSVNFFVNLYGKSLVVDGYYFGEYFIFILKFSLQYEILKIFNLVEKTNSISFWMKDVDGNYLNVNERWLKLAGFSNKMDVVGVNSYDIWPRDEAEVFEKNEKEVMESKLIKTFEEKISSIYGENIIDTTLCPILDINNKPLGIIGIAIDGEYRMKFYSNLKENESNFKEIAKYSDSIFFIRDEEKVIYMSPAYESIFEDSYEYFANDVYKFNDFFKNEENKDGLLENYSFDKLNEGKLKAKLKNGKEKWIWYKFLPVYDDCGNAIKRIGILTDVTKDINLEEEKEKIRLDFFANISHEFRTPVNLLLSTIEVLKLKLNNLDQENHDYFSKYIDIMQQNSFRLLKLVNNLIDSTKIDSGSMQINKINADIVSFIEDTCYSTMHHIKSKNMNLIFDTNKEEEIIGFDPNCIERVMLNLLSNAIKFNKENGNIFVNIDVDEENVVVEVRDEGFGIPKEKLESIFDKFEQVRTKMKSEREGSGIGLYIVKSLIKMHDGTIKAVSEVGKGSSIIFTLPRKIIENQGIDNIGDNKESNINKVILEFSDIYCC